METHSVDLTLAKGGSLWAMTIDGTAYPAGTYPAINVQKRAEITFTIHNAPGQHMTFSDYPLLVPPKPNVFSSPQGGGTQITVTDHNAAQDQVPYVLLFNGGPKLDPIINNNGGGHTSPLSTALLVTAAVGLAVGIFVGLVLQKRYRWF